MAFFFEVFAKKKGEAYNSKQQEVTFLLLLLGYLCISLVK